MADLPTHYEGFATMFMRIPMSSSLLPVQGHCIVDDRRVTLKFPFTGIEFDLPSHPDVIVTAHQQRQTQQQHQQEESGDNNARNSAGAADFDFKIRGSRGDLLIAIHYVPELLAFTGIGRQEGEKQPALTFCFFPSNSLLGRLPKVA